MRPLANDKTFTFSTNKVARFPKKKSSKYLVAMLVYVTVY